MKSILTLIAIICLLIVLKNVLSMFNIAFNVSECIAIIALYKAIKLEDKGE